MDLQAAHPFLAKLLPELRASGIRIDGFACDHICYRVSTLEAYAQEKQNMQGLGVLLSEVPINGRPIASYKLHQPIQFENYSIPVLELPAPKPGHETRDGFEHIEFATGFHPKQFIELYPQIEFKTNGLHKRFNPEIEVKFASGSVKFHELSLEKVIEIELAEGAKTPIL